MNSRRPSRWWSGLISGVAVGCTLLSFNAVAQSAPTDDVLIKLMQQFAARGHSRATFVERKTLAVLKRPVESSGELVYVAPDHLEKLTLLPKPEKLQLDQGMLSVQRGKRRYNLAMRDYPDVAAFVDTIRATLAGDLPALERSFTLEFRQTSSDWVLVLQPREPRLARLITRIRITGKEAGLNEVTIESADGDRSVMTIHESAGL
jgi:hypothetical protein